MAKGIFNGLFICFCIFIGCYTLVEFAFWLFEINEYEWLSVPVVSLTLFGPALLTYVIFYGIFWNWCNNSEKKTENDD